MSNVWPIDKIRELLSRAEAEGLSCAELESPRHAELFRHAIYSFRRRHNFGHGLSVTLNGNKVFVEKTHITPVRLTADIDARSES